MHREIIPYKEEFGPINWQEGFKEELTGKVMEEQARCYAWVKDTFLSGIPSYKRLAGICTEHPDYSDYIEPIFDTDALIVKDDLVVGVAHKIYYYDSRIEGFSSRYEYIMPYGRYCYDSSSDNNGAGYKERKWYKYLMCLPTDHTLWK